MKLTDWPQVEEWQKNVQEMRSRLPNPQPQHAANIKIDMNYIRQVLSYCKIFYFTLGVKFEKLSKK